jgi:predicted O-methyltransferase YrrM
MTDRIRQEIAHLESFSKRGESYSDGKGRYGWRNPIREDTGSLLTALVVAASPKRMLEIGTAHGLSALYLVSGMPAGGVLHTIEFDEAVADDTQRRMDACGVPVKVLCGEALQVIGGLEGRYDLVFFDAQKDQYLPQLQALLAGGFVGRGTTLLADNVTDRRAECQPFLDWITANGLRHQVLPTECGLLVATID